MAFDASLAKLQAEASCPICLVHLRDPVTIDCGHNFCSSCIRQRWEGLRGTFPCPVCLHHCPDRSLKRNPQLCDMTKIVQQISTSGSQRKLQGEIPLCGKHNEVLTLFDEENMELLCAQCRLSSDHQDQRLIPIEKAAASHRWMLKGLIWIFTNHLEVSETIFTQVANTWKVKEKMEKWREELHCECNQFKYSLEIEQDEIDINLFIEEKDVEEKLIENGRHISNHMFRLSNLLIEIEEKCLQTDLDLLIGIESNHNSYENLEPPALFACELKKDSFFLPPNYLGLHKMTHTFPVDLTLDPETAHPSLIISRKRKIVCYRPSFDLHNSQAHTSYPAVLSCEGFEAGRHFWQVEIRGIGECSLGVCKESFPRNTLISPSPSNGCWIHTFGPFPLGQRQIGVFLDYELGEVSFYNLNNYSYLYGITATFTGKLRPYFSIASLDSLLIRIIRV
ncbi:tripartite motif-containing protein 60-like [Pipistrellus kuhlii]|uniref:tripartite motif-containing protein 60-like n=1 Tax=Pipistrellus kuhlii TaxID=59472 RepID=UPI00174F785E|nr:tripartite motif-containing protein 60-like [Pipistrellus kuhlii]